MENKNVQRSLLFNVFCVIVFNPLFDIYFQLIETCIGATYTMQNGTLYMN